MTQFDDDPRDLHCPEADRIVDVCQSLGTDPIEKLEHILDCTDCRSVVESMATVQAAYAPGSDQSAALAQRVSRELALSGRATAAPPRKPEVAHLSGLSRWGLVGANWAVAAMAGFWGVLLVSPGNAGVGLGGAVLAGVLTGFIPVVGLIGRRPIEVG